MAFLFILSVQCWSGGGGWGEFGPLFPYPALGYTISLGVTEAEKFIENRQRSGEKGVSVGEGGAADVAPSPISGFPALPNLGVEWVLN